MRGDIPPTPPAISLPPSSLWSLALSEDHAAFRSLACPSRAQHHNMLSPTQWGFQRRYVILVIAILLVWFMLDFRQSLRWQDRVSEVEHSVPSTGSSDNHHSASPADSSSDSHDSATPADSTSEHKSAPPPTSSDNQQSAPPAASSDTHQSAPPPSPSAESDPTPSSAAAGSDAELSCESLQNLNDVYVIMRTGANEAPRKLPAHFNTTLRCLSPSSYGIWSDLEEDIGGFHIGNALDAIDPEIVSNHPDFGYYRILQDKGRNSFSEEDMTAWATAPNSDAGRDTPGWRLDKWKFLTIGDKAYKRRPDAKWFIFMEGDTYVDIGSAVKFLGHLDSKKPYYLGNPMQIGDDLFAYGGSSFILSNTAMKTLFDQHANNPGKYEDVMANHWAGDCVLGKMLKDAGIDLTWAWPTFYGDAPYDMDYNTTYGGGDITPFCHYAMTYHHLSPGDINEFYVLQQKWAKEVSTPAPAADQPRVLMLIVPSTRVCFDMATSSATLRTRGLVPK